MTTLDRYLTGIFIKNFGMAIAGLSMLFLFQALFGDLLDHTYTSQQILIYHFMDLPQIIVQMTAPAVLLATVLTLSGLSRTNELVACFSIGLGLKRITLLIISVVFIISCLTLVMEDRVLPLSFRARTTYNMRVMQKRPDFFLDVKQDKIWYRSKNIIFNLQRFDPKTKTIHGMAVYTFDDDFDLIQAVDAEKAEFTPTGWKLIDGSVTVFSKEDPFPQTQHFEEKGLLISETPKDFQEIEKEVEGLRLKELYRYIQKIKAAGADTKSYEVKFWSRFSLSFIPIVMCFLGVPFSVRGRREGGTLRDFGLSLAVIFFYWLFYSIGLSLGTNGALPPWVAAWLPSGIFIGLAAILISRKQ